MLSNSPKLREVIYLLGVFINGVMATATLQGVVMPKATIILVGGINAVMAVIARSNVTPEE